MMTDSEMMRPFDSSATIALLSMDSPFVSKNHSTTVSCPANIAPNSNKPHRLVPMNFQTRGSRLLPGGDTGATSAGLSAAVMVLSPVHRRLVRDSGDQSLMIHSVTTYETARSSSQWSGIPTITPARRGPANREYPDRRDRRLRRECRDPPQAASRRIVQRALAKLH